MQSYDVVIIGAGIGGTGLAFNLKREAYKGSVLVIDNKGAGSSSAYGYKNTFKEVIKEYGLPYSHIYKGMKLGALGETLNANGQKYITLDEDFYFVDYNAICQSLLKRSKAEFRVEKALSVKDNILTTDHSKYKFKYLIDCTGANLFLKRLLKLPLPLRYWVGHLKVIDRKYLKTDAYDDKYFYYIVDNSNYLEDFYIFEKKVLWGIWLYTEKVNFSALRKIRKTNFDEHFSKGMASIDEHSAIGPVAPAFPMAYRNYAFLGDSFGHATPSAGEGIRPILDSSKMLSKAIKAGRLALFTELWKEKYLDLFIKHLALKMNPSNRIAFIRALSSNPDIFMKILKNENFQLPADVKKKISAVKKIQVIFNYYKLKSIMFRQERLLF